MTTYAEHRCRHCRSPYTYQGSGEGCHNPLNHDRYCPTCIAVIREALERVPPKFERVYVPVSDVTLAEVLQWEKERDEAAKAEGRLLIRRVSAPLFDMNDPTNHNRTGFVRGKGDHARRTFRYSYWTGRGISVLEEEVERNITTGKIRPWWDGTRG